MLLKNLLKNLGKYEAQGNLDINVKGLSEDSRNLEKDFLFVAVKGLTVDGHDYIKNAVEKGATAVIGEKSLDEIKIPSNVTYVKVNNSRKSLGLAASNFYGEPSKKVKVIGVTGTDGKTTTSSIIYNILNKSGKKAGLISTVSAKIGNEDIDTGFHVTNPDPVLLQKLLSDMVDEGCEYAVVEVTSHGLDQDRVAGTVFDSAVLTNITREHLDYHKTFENYRDTKLKLFLMAKSGIVVNFNDPSCEYIISKAGKNIKKHTYGLSDKADIYATNLEETPGKSKFTINFKGEKIDVQTRLLGKYNISNSLAAAMTSIFYGATLPDIKKALDEIKPPEGRLEEIENDRGVKIYVDFAHTPNALENVLTLLRMQKAESQRLIAIFGCASERDDSKRPIMGEISTRIADISIFTAEDPRREDINKIINEMAGGVKEAVEVSIDNLEHLTTLRSHSFIRVPERGEAISYAINKIAHKGDIVVTCGKGHEKSMNYNGVEYAWSDKKAVELALKGEVFKIER